MDPSQTQPYFYPQQYSPPVTAAKGGDSTILIVIVVVVILILLGVGIGVGVWLALKDRVPASKGPNEVFLVTFPSVADMIAAFGGTLTPDSIAVGANAIAKDFGCVWASLAQLTTASTNGSVVCAAGYLSDYTGAAPDYSLGKYPGSAAAPPAGCGGAGIQTATSGGVWLFGPKPLEKNNKARSYKGKTLEVRPFAPGVWNDPTAK